MSSNAFFLQNGPKDIVSSTKFSPYSNNKNLIVSSWDKNIKLYDVSKNSSNQLIEILNTDAPVLDTCWASDYIIYSASLDGKLTQFDLKNGYVSLIGRHKEGVSACVFDDSTNTIFTGSWDQTINAYDAREPSSYDKIELPGKVYRMDLCNNYLVVALSERLIYIYDTRNMDLPIQKRESSLKLMTRALKCMPNGSGYITSSIEGRVAVEFFDTSEKVQAKKYAFKCHRHSDNDQNDLVYPINALAFHPNFPTFFTGASDSLVCLWDYESKKRLRQYPKFPAPVQTLDVNSTGEYLAIGVSHGFETGEDNLENTGVYIRQLNDAEFRSKASTH